MFSTALNLMQNPMTDSSSDICWFESATDICDGRWRFWFITRNVPPVAFEQTNKSYGSQRRQPVCARYETTTSAIYTLLLSIVTDRNAMCVECQLGMQWWKVPQSGLVWWSPTDNWHSAGCYWSVTSYRLSNAAATIKLSNYDANMWDIPANLTPMYSPHYPLTNEINCTIITEVNAFAMPFILQLTQTEK